MHSILAITPFGAAMQRAWRGLSAAVIIISSILPLCTASHAQIAGVRKNMGENVNTQWDDINPIISADGRTLYFARKNYPLNIHANDKDIFGRKITNNKTLEIWYSQLQKDSTWSFAQNLRELNPQPSNGVCTILPDNNTALYLWAYDEQGNATYGLIHRTANGWTKPVPLHIKNFHYIANTTISGSLASDGKTLMLAYKTPGCQAFNNTGVLDYADMNIIGMNIYVSFLEDETTNTWSEPKNLGNSINTQYSEFEPLLAPDGVTLFFSSARPGGIGDVDIYMAQRLDSTWTNWTQPVNLGEGFNIPGYNAINSITASGDYAYTTGMVENPTKNMDIFRVKMPERFHIKPVVLVKGRVFARLQTPKQQTAEATSAKTIGKSKKNAATAPDPAEPILPDTTKPLDAEIIYERLSDGKQMGIAHTNPRTGEYEIALPCGTNYGFRAEREGYLPVNENLDLSAITQYQELNRDIILTPYAAGNDIVLHNLFFDQDKADIRAESYPELSRFAGFMKQHATATVEIDGHTDDVGTDDYNNALSLRRAEAVVKYLAGVGVNAKRMKAKGFGKSQPVASNDTDEGKQKNRRVVMKLISK